MERITERTLYPPLLENLSDIGFGGTQETKLSGQYPDITFWTPQDKFIVEVKIGEEKKLIEGLAEVYEHARLANTENQLVLVYPPNTRSSLVDKVDRIALDTRVTCLILTKYWRQKIQSTPRAIFYELSRRIKEEELSPTSVDFVVESLRDAVEAFSETLREHEISELTNAVDLVVGRFDLFMALSDVKESEQGLRAASLDMLSYLLVNQILFYHIYSKISGQKKLPRNRRVDELPLEIQSLSELMDYFKQITDINYKAIYSIEVARHLPSSNEIKTKLNQLLKAIHALQPETVQHDLLGRLFHELLPQKARKMLAAFYTKPQAAEMLATLCITNRNSTVIDPACGSGTLVVAAYRRKQRLIESLSSKPPQFVDLIHKQFVEHDITCMDVMPFAAHITAVNLSSQTITAKTNRMRVGVGDSLALSNKDLSKGAEIPTFTSIVQKTLVEHLGDSQRWSKGSLSADGRGEPFALVRNDCVIMNPPFTDRKRLPSDYRSKLMDQKRMGKLIRICGSGVNLWGYFLALADLLLKEDGRLGAVIPVNILRGKSTQMIRDYLLVNYRIKYVITSLVDIAFSESAVYRDLLFVAEKNSQGSEVKDNLVAFVFLKYPLNNQSLSSSQQFGSKILELQPGDTFSSDDFSIVWISQELLIANKKNLMRFLRLTSESQGLDAIEDLLAKIKNLPVTNLIEIADEDVIRGFEQSPRGLPQMCFVARPIDKARLKRAFLVLQHEKASEIQVGIKNTPFQYDVPSDSFLPALRSLTNLQSFNITGSEDFIIKGEYPNWEEVLHLTEWRGDFDWSIVENKLKDRIGLLFIATRFRPGSSNTHFLAFTRDSPFVTTNKFTLIRVKDNDEAIVQCLLLNSIVTIASVIEYMNTETGGFVEIKHYDLSMFYRFDCEKLDSGVFDDLLALGKQLAKVKFPSLVEQLRSRFEPRIRIDKAILSAIGFRDQAVENIILKLYDSVLQLLLKLQERPNSSGNEDE